MEIKAYQHIANLFFSLSHPALSVT